MTNLNKNSSGRSITPTNNSIKKGGASREFLNKSVNAKNPVGSNASFSSGFGMKKGSISKSPSNYNKKISISRPNNDKSFDINVNKSYDKSREFNPKSTFKINSKSPVASSRLSVKKPNYGNISISTNSSPIYRGNKSPVTNKSPDNHTNKPSIYSNFIKKKPNNISTNTNSTNVKKIVQQNPSSSAQGNNSNVNQNVNNKNANSNMNSIDVSTNNTNGLNSNNNLNNFRNIGNNNENDCFHQIQPKYEEDKFKQNNLNANNSNNINVNKQQRENKFVNNNNQNVDFKQMNTSPLLRV